MQVGYTGYCKKTYT